MPQAAPTLPSSLKLSDPGHLGNRPTSQPAATATAAAPAGKCPFHHGPAAASPTSTPGAITPAATTRRAQIQQAYLANPSQMTLLLARKLGVPELEVLRALPAEMAAELNMADPESLIRSFESLGPVHVISSNAACTLECFGTFGNFSTWGDFFNVQTKSLDMHINLRKLAAAFAVEKPGHMDAVNTLSFQLFDQDGSSAFKVFLTFGGDKPSPEKRNAFEMIKNRFLIHAIA